MIVYAHTKELICIKLHQTVFLTGLDKYICLHCTKKAFYKGLIPLIAYFTVFIVILRSCAYTFWNSPIWLQNIPF